MKYYFLFFLFLFPKVSPVVIIIHGSFAAQEEWCLPSGDFFKNITQTAKSHKQKTLSFSWSGNPTYQNIFIGAQRLAQLILSYPDGERIILVGHSHGGNVISLASQIIHDPLESVMEKYIAMTHQDFLNEAAEQAKQNHKPTTIDPFGCNEFAGSATPSTYRALLRLVQKTTLLKKFQTKSKTNKKHFLIEAVYQLGTPIHLKSYRPEMATIHHLYNLYSDGDLIQTIAGTHAQTYPPHKRMTNLAITVANTGYFSSNKPTHSEMHHPLIGTWLLLLPDILKVHTNHHEDGSLHFSENSPPKYTQRKF